ncbi:MAG: ABC transporter substrate-binding protein [Chloroflexota bacterium]|nr:ABC transporter substrate-binding protein [Chloroflexota bacterium]
MKRSYVSRRTVLRGAAASSAAAVGAGTGVPGISEVLAARKAPAHLRLQEGRLVYWGGLIFSDDANNMLVEEVAAWGEANGVETETVMINQNETVQRVSAAVESGTMPDALDMGLDLLLLLSNSDQLNDLTDMWDSVGEAQGGWYESVANAASAELLGGARTGLPFGASGNLLFSRTDALEAAGLTPPPGTWEELADFAREAQAPPLYGMGLALSNVGDGNLQVSVMQSYGGRVADDAGTTCTINSDATRTYLEWVATAYNDGLFPPGATTWDGAGDNTAYQSGQAIFIANTGSVSLALADTDPELLEMTSYSPLPAGPEGRISPISLNLRAIPTSTADVDRAKSLLEHLSRPEFMSEYFKVAIYGPVLQDQAEFEAYAESPVLAGLSDLVEDGTPPGAPDVYNTAYADFNANFIVPKMVQRVVIDEYDLDQAMEEAQTQGQAIYDKY